MGGTSVDVKWELTAPDKVRTVVLVGRAGNGKSATGNSILGRKAFISKLQSNGVTSTCQLQSAVVRDGQLVNVIDTPGLFDFSAGFDVVAKEIVNCIDLAKDGIHAFLVVFSVRNRFTREEADVLQNLPKFFGEKISDYMIIVFTGGDELEDNDETLADYMGRNCPKPLQEVLKSCQNRVVLFNNKTKNETQKSEQLQQLLAMVNMVMVKNEGRPYSREFFVELMVDKKVEAKLKKTTEKYQEQLAEEKAARLKAQEMASDENRQLRQSLEKAYRENEELRKGGCAIL